MIELAPLALGRVFVARVVEVVFPLPPPPPHVTIESTPEPLLLIQPEESAKGRVHTKLVVVTPDWMAAVFELVVLPRASLPFEEPVDVSTGAISPPVPVYVP